MPRNRHKRRAGQSALEPAAPPRGEETNRCSLVLGLAPANPGEQTALRVTVTSSTLFPEIVGWQWWVGPPVEISENSGKTDPDDAPPGTPTFWGATLQCDPYYQDWHGRCVTYHGMSRCAGGLNLFASCSVDEDCRGVLHIYDEGIVPDATYEIQAIQLGSSIDVEDAFSDALSVSTARWGDLCGPWDGVNGWWSPPDGQIDITTDLTAILNKFQNLSGAPIKARSDMDFQLPDLKVNISDVTLVQSAFGGGQYPYGPPIVCGP